jgi:hypothetical protein
MPLVIHTGTEGYKRTPTIILEADTPNLRSDEADKVSEEDKRPPRVKKRLTDGMKLGSFESD